MADLPTDVCPKNTILYLMSHNLVLSSNIAILIKAKVIYYYEGLIINYYPINIILKMIRQHFYPKHQPIKLSKKDQRQSTNS